MSCRRLKSYQQVTIIYDFTVEFCECFIDKIYPFNQSNPSHQSYPSYSSYQSYFNSLESAAHRAICFINQTNFLLDSQIKFLKEKFIKEGGWTEKLFLKRENKKRLIKKIYRENMNN